MRTTIEVVPTNWWHLFNKILVERVSISDAAFIKNQFKQFTLLQVIFAVTKKDPRKKSSSPMHSSTLIFLFTCWSVLLAHVHPEPAVPYQHRANAVTCSFVLTLWSSSADFNLGVTLSPPGLQDTTSQRRENISNQDFDEQANRSLLQGRKIRLCGLPFSILNNNIQIKI